MKMKDIEAMMKKGRIRGFSAIPANGKKMPDKLPITETGPKVLFKIALTDYCRRIGRPLFIEQRFHVKRKWRLDFLIPGPVPVGIEYEGIFSKDANANGHQNQRHYIKDTQKYNAAAGQGIRVLRYTAKTWQEAFIDLQIIFYDQIK